MKPLQKTCFPGSVFSDDDKCLGAETCLVASENILGLRGQRLRWNEWARNRRARRGRLERVELKLELLKACWTWRRAVSVGSVVTVSCIRK